MRLIHSARRMRGVTLVELMVGIALGIFLVGGVISLFTSNQQNFRVNDNLARLQESARFAYEQMNREIRDAGTNPCGVRAVNSVVRTPTAALTPWWGDWNAGTVRGYDGSEEILNAASSINNRVSGTDAIVVMRTQNDDGQLRVVTAHDISNPTSHQFTINTSASFSEQDLMFVCDSNSGAIFEIASPASPPATVVTYDTTDSLSNCSLFLGWANNVNCNVNAVTKTFAVGSYITKFDPAIWYIGDIAGKRALFRETMHKAGGSVSTERREYVPDVHDMQITYLMRTKSTDPAIAPSLATNWVQASVVNSQTGTWSATNLAEAVAVKIELTFRSKESVGSDGVTSAPLERKSIAVISLRNREIAR
jgi:type IV pilus assembly protein PilW